MDCARTYLVYFERILCDGPCLTLFHCWFHHIGAEVITQSASPSAIASVATIANQLIQNLSECVFLLEA